MAKKTCPRRFECRVSNYQAHSHQWLAHLHCAGRRDAEGADQCRQSSRCPASFTGADTYSVRYAEQTDLFAAAKADLEVQLAAPSTDDRS